MLKFDHKPITNTLVKVGEWRMAKNKPTEAELDILSVLWQSDGSTVRDVFEKLSDTRPVTYTTFLKLMQIMDEKGLVERDTKNKAHIYRAKLDQKEAQTNYTAMLVEKVFGGSAKQLILQVIESKTVNAEDLKDIRKLLKQDLKVAKASKKKVKAN